MVVVVVAHDTEMLIMLTILDSPKKGDQHNREREGDGREREERGHSVVNN